MMPMAIRRKKLQSNLLDLYDRRSDRLLDDKRKTPCCLMAAWGFAMGRMPDQVGHDDRGRG